MFNLFKKDKKPMKDNKRFEDIVATEDPVTDLVHPEAAGFSERVTAKQLPKGVFLWKCSCGNRHFRHAGYVESMTPFMRAGGEKRVAVESYQVKICTKCKKAYCFINEQMYDISEHIDVNAWEETEKLAHKATGPGGQC